MCREAYENPEYQEYCPKGDATTNDSSGSVSVDMEQYTGRKIINGKVADVLED